MNDVLHPKLPISLILVASNEAHQLPRCLDSVAPWVSEIIAVINNCTDNTREILESYGAKVYEHAWMGMAPQKGLALAKATQPWVFNIDADEVCSPELTKAIESFILNNDNSFNGAIIPRRSWYLGRWIRHGDWYPDAVLRLFRRDKGEFHGDKDHDKVLIQGSAKRLRADLYHYSFPSLNKQIEKMPPFGDAFLGRQLARGRRWSAPKAITRSLWRFFRAYILRCGFLDGYPGFYIAWFQAFSTLYRYTKVYEHEKQQQAHLDF
tara:strand:- start:135 stop:929 length:795 start_codon:yes stop_codon:yes gene_type:complete